MRQLFAVWMLLSLGACSSTGDLDSFGRIPNLSEWLAGEDNSIEATTLGKIKNPLTLTTVWQHSLNHSEGADAAQLQLAVDGAVVVAATHGGEVSARDLATGNLRWKIETGSILSGGVGLGGQYIAVASSDGDLIVLQRSDGSELWRANTGGEILSVPAISDDRIVVQTIAGSVISFDVKTGERAWVFDRSVPVLSLRGSSSPLLVDDLVLSGAANGKLSALDAEKGWMKWKSNVAVPHGRSELERMVDLDATILVDEGVVYAAAYQGRVVAIDLYSGRIFWARDISSYQGLAFDKRQLYVTDEESRLWALDRRNGASLWKQEGLQGRKISAPTVYGDYIVVGDFSGVIHFLSTSDGSFVARANISSQGLLAAPVVVANGVLIYSKSGKLALLKIAQ